MSRALIVDPEAIVVSNDVEQIEQTREDNLPEKYRGKSAADIIHMHQEAERELGRARNEIGDVRKLADQLIGIRTAETQINQQSNKMKPLSTEELLDNPEESVVAIAKREANEAVRQQTERLNSLELQNRDQAFRKAHPDFQEVATSSEFKDWALSSTYRQRLAAKAKDGDYDAADELFSLYKEVRPKQGDEDDFEEESSKKTPSAAKRAGTVKSGGSTASGVITRNKPQGEVFKRADLIRMRIENPDEFDRRQPDILRAYKDGRVR